MVKQGSGKITKNTAEREVAKLMPFSDPLTPITTFRSDYGLRKQVCPFSSFCGNRVRRNREGGREGSGEEERILSLTAFMFVPYAPPPLNV
jgi:hypothetical protein